MRHGSLFSGIGGFDLAAEWCGWENVFHCEWNTFGQKVLKHHFPNSISYNDITKTDFSIHRGTIDIISGGFPCQPYSSAGKRLGKEDERHLWPEMLRAIREIQPSWVVGENVRGLTNWNGGLVFDEVQTELEAEGYEVLPFLLPACAVNAPHRRDRIWFIAYSNTKQREWKERRFQSEFTNGSTKTITDTNCNGLEQCNSAYEIKSSNGRIDAFSNINESDGNGIATNTNLYGQQQERGYDWSSQDVNGCNNQEFGSTNTKDIDRCSTNGDIKGQPCTCNGTCIKGVYEKNQTSYTNRVCRMDQNNRNAEGIIAKTEFETNESRALVQEGQDRFQLSINRGLDFNQEPLSSTNGIGQQDDLSRVNRMEQNATNSNSTDNKTQSQKGILGQENKGQSTRGLIDGYTRTQWNDFPTKSPVCGGDDGLPRELDNITFSKWRNESIKAYGNAIVPQVAYQIFKSICQYQKL
jgi:DNA-cytosine methyltransferase